jgi:hypothetical protein
VSFANILFIMCIIHPFSCGTKQRNNNNTIEITHYQAQEHDQALTELKRALTLGRIVWGRGHEDTVP